MRILIFGNFRTSTTNESQYARTLELMGHNVIRMQETRVTRDQLLEEGLKCSLVVTIHTHGWETKGKISWKKLSETLRRKKIPFISYHLDLWFGLEREKDLQDEYYQSLHHFFTVDKLMADWLNKNTKVKGHYLPAGIYGPECIMNRAQRVVYDIVFTGSGEYHKEYPFRQELISFLEENYGRRFIHIGKGGDFSDRRGLPLNQIYRNAKITIGDTLNIDFKYPYYFSDRLFEQSGRGAFQIFPDIKGIEEMYKDGVEIVLYKAGDLDDLKTKIDRYLTSPLEREAIRQAGFNRTKREHTYAHRWAEILRTVGKS